MWVGELASALVKALEAASSVFELVDGWEVVLAGEMVFALEEAVGAVLAGKLVYA